MYLDYIKLYFEGKLNCKIEGCENIFKNIDPYCKSITCDKCLNELCPKCLMSYHSPCDCKMVSEWNNILRIKCNSCPQETLILVESDEIRLFKCPECKKKYCSTCFELLKNHE